MYLIVILNILFALTFIIAKEVLSFGKPLFFVGFRMVLAGFMLLLYNRYIYKRLNFRKKDVPLYLTVAVFHIFLPYIFEFWALQYITAAKTAMLFNLSPFITAILVYLLFTHKLSKQKFLGLIIGFLGFMPLLISTQQDQILTKQVFFISLPELFVILSVVSSALGWIIIQKYSTNIRFSFLNGVAMFGGGILALITSLIFEGVKSPIYDLKYFLFYTLLIIIIGNFICYNLYGYLLQSYSATLLSFAGFMIPIFTSILQYIFFETTISFSFILTIFLVFIGLYIFYKDELRL